MMNWFRLHGYVYILYTKCVDTKYYEVDSIVSKYGTILIRASKHDTSHIRGIPVRNIVSKAGVAFEKLPV